MEAIRWLVNHVAPLFLITSPITSYADQIYSIHKSRSSAGFSLDIPLIMLLASLLKVFYWLGERYDTSLLFQALLMVAVQATLLHVALQNRPPASAVFAKPFTNVNDMDGLSTRRPYRFWQWQQVRPYWTFLAYYLVGLLVLEVVFGEDASYIKLQGYVALSIEALLPLPQIASNQRNRSCKGFRISVLLNWLIGDALKMTFFFLADSEIPLAFKACGTFQALCDCYLGVQYWMFGEGPGLSYTDEEGALRMK